MALGVRPGDEDAVLDYLRARELISSAYVERNLPIRLLDGRTVTALTYVIDAAHIQYCGGLPLPEQAGIIARAVGGRGPNAEYLYNTADHLAAIGLHDAELEWLAAEVRRITA
jgi:cation transport protein ChaC